MGLVLALVGLKEEAVEVYRRCSTLDGAGLKDPRTHETTKISALFNLGRLYADDGQYAKAIDVYTEAVQRMPPHYQPQVSCNCAIRNRSTCLCACSRGLVTLRALCNENEMGLTVEAKSSCHGDHGAIQIALSNNNKVLLVFSF